MEPRQERMNSMVVNYATAKKHIKKRASNAALYDSINTLYDVAADYVGKKFSVLADSLSAYAGYIPDGNKPYYTGQNAGVDDVSQMWWSQIATAFSMTPCVINAWSGSKVSDIDATTQGFTPMADAKRCQALHAVEGSLSLQKETGSYFAVSDGKISKSTNVNYESAIIDVAAGECLLVSLISMSPIASYITATNDLGVVIQDYITGSGTAMPVTDYAVTVPDGATKLYLTSRITSTHTDKDLSVRKGATANVLGKAYKVVDDKVEEISSANYNSIVCSVKSGDELLLNFVTMSTNADYIIAVNWRGEVVDKQVTGTGTATPIRMYHYTVPANAVKLYVSSRVRSSGEADDLLLQYGSVPDVIFFWGGANDFSKDNAAIGDYNGGVWPTSISTFSDAYATAIKLMQQKYPRAEIICLSFPMITRTKTAANGTEVNSEGKSIADYNDVIRKIAAATQCKYLDVTSCGITRQNAYPTYCVDSATVPLHPNKLGQELYAKQIIRGMLK